MALDAVTTSLVGLGVGAIGVVVHAGAHYADGSLKQSRERTLLALFFTLMAGFLFAWVWVYTSPTLADLGGMGGTLWGGLVWLTFVLPAEIAHIVWDRQDVTRAGVGLASWLGQFLVGGAICGVVLTP